MRRKDSKKRRHGAGFDSDWKNLGVHPAFLIWVGIYQGGVRELYNIEAQKLPLDRLNEAKQELGLRIHKRIDDEVRPLMPYRIDELAGMGAYYGVSWASLKQAPQKGTSVAAAYGIGLMEFDSQNRYHKPLHAIVQEHVFGNPESTSKYLRLESNRQAVRYGLGLPPFKGNIDHRIIMQTGLGLGLERLSPIQLEHFYGEYCPCKEDHDSNDLGKLRNRILREGQEARDAVTPKFTGTNQIAE